jgi:hypothetical protein
MFLKVCSKGKSASLELSRELVKNVDKNSRPCPGLKESEPAGVGFQYLHFNLALEKNIFLKFYYSYVHTRLGSFLPPAPTPSLTTHSAPSLSPHSIPSRNYFALISNFVVERV